MILRYGCVVVAASGCAGVLGLEESNRLTVTQLDIQPGTLTPRFDPDVGEYALTFTDGVAEFDVTATSSDPDAELSFEGVTSLVPTMQSIVPIGTEVAAIALLATSPTGIETRYSITLDRTPFGIDFAPPQMLTVSGVTNSLAVGDVNKDTLQDIGVTTAPGPGATPDLLLNTGGGMFQKSSLPANGDPIAFGALVDNNDSPDLVLGGATTAVISNTGPGTFPVSGTQALSSINAQGIAIGEFTGDARLDLALVGSGQLCVFRGDASGQLQAITPCAAVGVPSAVVSAQFDTLPGPDLAIIDANTNIVRIMANTGGGTFAERQLMVGTPGMPLFAMATADFDNDGRADLALTNPMGDRVELVTEIGSADKRSAIDVTRPGGIAAGDLDGDGKIDLVVANAEPDPEFTVLRNLGDGTFATKTFIVPHPPRKFAIADVTGDGRQDIVMTTITNIVLIVPGKP